MRRIATLHDRHVRIVEKRVGVLIAERDFATLSLQFFKDVVRFVRTRSGHEPRNLRDARIDRKRTDPRDEAFSDLFFRNDRFAPNHERPRYGVSGVFVESASS